MVSFAQRQMNQAGRAARAQEGMEWGMMKRWLCLLLAVCLLPVCAVAEEQDFLTVTVEHAWADEATGNQRIVISYAYPDDLCDVLLNLSGQGACQGLWSESPAEDVCHA